MPVQPQAKDVTIQTHGHDKYTRTIGEVLLADGMNLNQELVKQGWCWSPVHRHHHSRTGSRYCPHGGGQPPNSRKPFLMKLPAGYPTPLTGRYPLTGLESSVFSRLKNTLVLHPQLCRSNSPREARFFI